MSGGVVGLVVLIVCWAIAGLIMWGAVETGKYFFSQTDGTDGGPSTLAKIAGILIPLLFIAPSSVAFFFAGISSGVAGVAVDSN